MVWLTLFGALAAFWGFFGWFSEHKETPFRWVALGYSLINLWYCGELWRHQVADLWDAMLAVLVGGIALVLCYKT